MNSSAETIARVFWILYRETPFTYAHFETEHGCHHQTARAFLKTMVAHGILGKVEGRGGRTRREVTRFFPLKHLRDRYEDTDDATALLHACLQLFHYTPAVIHDPIVAKVENFLKFSEPTTDK